MTTAVGAVRRVLICEDSQTYAAALARLLSRDREIEVVAVCASAEEAIERLGRLPVKPDVVTMDLELPGMSGGDAIEQIMGAAPVPILVLSGAVTASSSRAREALEAGALDVISKDGLDLRDLDGADAQELRRRVKRLSGVRVLHHPRARLNRHLSSPDADGGERASVIGICASAGGPQAIAELLAEIPAGFTIPILVVQHMTKGFAEGFAHWLDDQVPLTVRIAEPGPAGAGVWVAPEGAHLLLDRDRRLTLDGGSGDEAHRPSGDVLLRSIAASAGRHGVAVVLSGMGSDGAEGLAAVRGAGGLTIAQDEESSVVFGMPRRAVERGAVLVLGPSAIGRRLVRLSSAKAAS